MRCIHIGVHIDLAFLRLHVAIGPFKNELCVDVLDQFTLGFASRAFKRFREIPVLVTPVVESRHADPGNAGDPLISQTLASGGKDIVFVFLKQRGAAVAVNVASVGIDPTGVSVRSWILTGPSPPVPS